MKLYANNSPHISGKEKTHDIMLDVIIALAPLGIAGTIFFGFRALLVIAVCVASAVIGEYLFNKAIKKETTIKDLSAVVTGLLLAYNLPSAIPLWIAALGSLIAVVIVKGMFGGLGQNFANPAITARIILMVSFPTLMSSFTPVFSNTTVVSSATPIKEIGLTYGSFGGEYSMLRLFLGDYAGCIGETSALLILLGGIYLVLRKVISPIIPFSFIGTTFLFTFILSGNFKLSVAAVLCGGVMLGAVFMATDYVTSPTSNLGKLIFGVGAGIITVLIRSFGNLPEGVSYSILLMNLFTPLIEKIPSRKPFFEEA